MYFMQKTNVIFRDYGSFGYITDNRNYGYRRLNDKKKFIGDRVVSESGAAFLSALSRNPTSIEDLAVKLMGKFDGVSLGTIKHDAIEFYRALESEGFIVSGNTIEECLRKNESKFSLKQECTFNEGSTSQSENRILSTQEFFEKYFNGEPQLLSLHIDILEKCNERCIHCFIPHEKKTTTMDSELFYDIIEQAKEMNILHLTISGGEPMVHDSFIDFLKKINEDNFSVNILSNLTLLNQNILNEMKKNPLLSVQTSLYSMDSDIHDSITKQKGSFEKTKNAILTLIENDIPVQISCPIMKQNLDSYADVIDWGRRNNIIVNSDYVIIAEYNHKNDNLNCRLSVGDVNKIMEHEAGTDPEYLASLNKEYLKKKNMSIDDPICSVCYSSLCIAENGNVYPCAGWQDYFLGNLKVSALLDIWQKSDKVKYLRDLRRRDFPKCLDCSQKEFCTMCMVRNANESPTGDPLEVNQYFCDIAKLNMKLYYKYQY